MALPNILTTANIIQKIATQIQTLFDCDLETGRYRKFKISEEQRRSFYEEAIKTGL